MNITRVTESDDEKEAHRLFLELRKRNEELHDITVKVGRIWAATGHVHQAGGATVHEMLDDLLALT